MTHKTKSKQFGLGSRLATATALTVFILGAGLFSPSWTADLPFDPKTKADRVIVLKSERKLLLMKNDQVVKTYRISLGGNPMGRKTWRGDSKTPEGEYVLDRRNEKSYFYRSIHISYPNVDDVARAKRLGVSPGGDVFIHGVPPQNREHTMPPDWTDGCIAVTNQEMDEIWRAVADGTHIVIKP